MEAAGWSASRFGRLCCAVLPHRRTAAPPRRPQPLLLPALHSQLNPAGIKDDLKRAKASGEAYDPRGVGAGYSHNFLNQKPWHPMNFRNQVKRYDAEQKALADEKAKVQAMVRCGSWGRVSS